METVKLKKGQECFLKKKVPLMPDPEPKDVYAALMKMIYIEDKFKVLEKRTVRKKAWYYVQSFDSEGNKLKTGWINSLALVGMDLRETK